MVWCGITPKDLMPKETVSRDVYTPPSARIAMPRLGFLRDDLPATVDLLKRRRADLISERSIEDYVALNWLEWNGGGLKLTITGENLCKQMNVGPHVENVDPPVASLLPPRGATQRASKAGPAGVA